MGIDLSALGLGAMVVHCGRTTARRAAASATASREVKSRRSRASCFFALSEWFESSARDDRAAAHVTGLEVGRAGGPAVRQAAVTPACGGVGRRYSAFDGASQREADRGRVTAVAGELPCGQRLALVHLRRPSPRCAQPGGPAQPGPATPRPAPFEVGPHPSSGCTLLDVIQSPRARAGQALDGVPPPSSCAALGPLAPAQVYHLANKFTG